MAASAWGSKLLKKEGSSNSMTSNDSSQQKRNNLKQQDHLKISKLFEPSKTKGDTWKLKQSQSCTLVIQTITT